MRKRPTVHLLNTMGQRAWLDSDWQEHKFSKCMVSHLRWPYQAISLCGNSLQAESFAPNKIVSFNSLGHAIYSSWNALVLENLTSQDQIPLTFITPFLLTCLYSSIAGSTWTSARLSSPNCGLHWGQAATAVPRSYTPICYPFSATYHRTSWGPRSASSGSSSATWKKGEGKETVDDQEIQMKCFVFHNNNMFDICHILCVCMDITSVL